MKVAGCVPVHYVNVVVRERPITFETDEVKGGSTAGWDVPPRLLRLEAPVAGTTRRVYPVDQGPIACSQTTFFYFLISLLII